MDIISHGLYRWAVFGNKKEFWLSIEFWILPDFLTFWLPFAINIITMLSGGSGSIFGQAGHHNIDAKYIDAIYNITHSLIIRGSVFWALWRIYKKPMKASFARLLHMLIDIPTHSLAFFATPFLWPIFNYKFDGIPRSNKIIFIPNIILLIILYSIYTYKKFHKTKKTKQHKKELTNISILI